MQRRASRNNASQFIRMQIDPTPVLPAPEDVHQQMRRGFLWILSTTALWQILSWILTLVTARLLVPGDYGLLAMIEAVMPYLIMLAAFKIDAWLIQGPNATPDEERTALFVVVSLGFTLSLVSFCASPLLAAYYHEPRLIAVARLLAPIFFLRSLQLVPEARLRRSMHFRSLALAVLAVNVLRGLLQIALALTGFAYWSLVCGMLFAEAANVLVFAQLAGFPRTGRWSPAAARAAFNFGASATGASLFWVIYSTADNLIVGRLFGTTVLGLYAMAFYLSDLPLSKINVVIGPLLLPFYSRLKHDRQALHAAYLKIIRSLLLLAAPVLVGLAVVAPIAVPLFLGDQWLGLIQPLQVLSAVGVLRALTVNTSSLFFAVGRPQPYFWWSASAAIVLPVSYYCLGSTLGLNGIFASWLVVYPLGCVIPLVYLTYRVVGVPIAGYLRAVMPPVAASIVIPFAVRGAEQISGGRVQAPLLLALEVMAGAVAYLLVLGILFPSVLGETLRLLRSRSV